MQTLTKKENPLNNKREHLIFLANMYFLSKLLKMKGAVPMATLQG